MTGTDMARTSEIHRHRLDHRGQRDAASDQGVGTSAPAPGGTTIASDAHVVHLR